MSTSTHRPSLMYRIGRFAASKPLVVIGLWTLLAVGIFTASSSFGQELDESFAVPGLDSQDAIDLLSRVDSDEAGLTATVVVTPHDDGVSLFDSPGAVLALRETRTALLALDEVISVTDPAAILEADPAAAVQSGVVSSNGRIALMRVQYPLLDSLGPEDLAQLEETVEVARTESSLQVEAGGDIFYAFDSPEPGVGEAIGLIVAMIVLLVAFRSIVAMGVPIFMALFGLAIGITSLGLVTYVIDIPSWMPQIGIMVGLGVGIDYALFLVTRHREFLAKGLSPSEAAGRANATAGKAVLFAGGTVVVSILGLAVSGVPFVAAAGVGIALIVLVMVLASVTLLPALLGLFGSWVNRLGFKSKKAKAANKTANQGWERWGRHVTSHPWKYAIGVTLLLLAATSPVLALELGIPDDGNQPESKTQRRAFDLVSEGFGLGSNGPLLVAVDLAGETGESAVVLLDGLASAVAADPGVTLVAPPAINEAAGVATLVAIPVTGPQDRATVELVSRLREDVLPAALGDSPAFGHVGGQTASVNDIATQIADRMPYFIAAVLILSFLLLMLLFRSVLVPLKAAILNLLSIGASYGVLVMVFQWGWGKDLIGLESTLPVASFVPMFMFAIVFGLSMDYEVFLLSRVREDYLATGDNDGSVIRGLAGTARVITSAALIMIAVFAGFVAGVDPVTKMFGLGLAVAVAVDASIVRIILVPATMKLMGDANWWLPGWLDKILPNVAIEDAAYAAVEDQHARGHGFDPGLSPADNDRIDYELAELIRGEGVMPK